MSFRISVLPAAIRRGIFSTVVDFCICSRSGMFRHKATDVRPQGRWQAHAVFDQLLTVMFAFVAARELGRRS